MTSAVNLRIESHDYGVQFFNDTNCVKLHGSLRLNAAPEYEPIAQLLDQALILAADSSKVLTLDLQTLKFLNSSGINLLYQFVLRVKKHGAVGLKVIGSSTNAWQPKSLSNMVKFMPTVELLVV
jgi:hypothetical protein